LSGALVVQAASKIYFGGNGDLSFGATLSGAARLTVTCGVARTLSVNSPSAFGGSYTGVVAMSGLSGTLNMNGYDTVLGGLAGTVGRVKNDPAGSQTQTRVLTLSLAAGTTNDFSGVLANGNWASEVLALTVTNSGVQKLRGRCTYTGATAVNGGTLTVNGLLSNSVATVAVNLGGTLGGTGRVARPVAVNAGGTLSPGDNGVGTLVTSNLTLAAGCTNVFELGTPGAGDKVAVIGDLTLGDCVVMVQNQPGFRADTYELFTYTGSLSPGSPSPTLILSGPWPARLDYSEPGKVKLVVSRWGPQVLLK
jgi:autotransporter-associated beta strand protein